MRMPIFSYFGVVGAIPFVGLVLVSRQLESRPLQVSQTVGVPPRFKALPENTQLPTQTQ
jgi:hypothetical protein